MKDLRKNENENFVFNRADFFTGLYESAYP